MSFANAAIHWGIHVMMVGLGLAGPGSAAESTTGPAGELEVAGVTVTPHVRALSMRYRREPSPELGARVQLFLRNAGTSPVRLGSEYPVHFDGRTAAQLLGAGEWTWHDTPGARLNETAVLPPGGMVVWSFNGRTARWGLDQSFRLEGGSEGAGRLRAEVPIAVPRVWLSAVTFLGPTNEVRPDRMVLHVANESGGALQMVWCRWWLPADRAAWQVLYPGQEHTAFDRWSADGVVAPGDRGVAVVRTGPLPLAHAVVEMGLRAPDGRLCRVQAYLRVKKEAFDISGGWVGGQLNNRQALTLEPFLQTLKRIHVNTGHIAATPGYTDNPELYGRYPLKYFNKLEPFDVYDTDAVLPRIHAVEFLGEPQYGGGRPVPPQEVFEKLAPYARTRLATTVTHSEERIWRDYAGLSDYAHYDAYRVTAPSPDAWRRYDRWDNKVKIGWGAPLETIGDMCRSLRELYRPAPTAYWSQGPHEGWDVYDGRRRTSPTPEELRLQAYHALATRITSLYWFNLSLKSLVKFRDTLDELGRVGREIRLLEDFYLEGDAYAHTQVRRAGRLDWDLATIAAPRGAVLFALDLDYQPRPEDKVFRFGPPRSATWEFKLPAYLRGFKDVFQVDAEGVRDVRHESIPMGVRITDTANQVAIYVVSPDLALRGQLQAKVEALKAYEASFRFDPGRNDTDFEALRALLR